MAQRTVHVEVCVNNEEALHAMIELEDYIDEVEQSCPWLVELTQSARESFEKLSDGLVLHQKRE